MLLGAGRLPHAAIRMSVPFNLVEELADGVGRQVQLGGQGGVRLQPVEAGALDAGVADVEGVASLVLGGAESGGVGDASGGEHPVLQGGRRHQGRRPCQLEAVLIVAVRFLLLHRQGAEVIADVLVRAGAVG